VYHVYHSQLTFSLTAACPPAAHFRRAASEPFRIISPALRATLSSVRWMSSKSRLGAGAISSIANAGRSAAALATSAFRQSQRKSATISSPAIQVHGELGTASPEIW
jgi:hypothetical protein